MKPFKIWQVENRQARLADARRSIDHEANAAFLTVIFVGLGCTVAGIELGMSR